LREELLFVSFYAKVRVAGGQQHPRDPHENARRVERVRVDGKQYLIGYRHQR
jgi:hypothetical protein